MSDFTKKFIHKSLVYLGVVNIACIPTLIKHGKNALELILTLSCLVVILSFVLTALFKQIEELKKSNDS